MNIKLNLNGQNFKSKSSKFRQSKGIFNQIIKTFNIRSKTVLTLVAFLTCLALSTSIFISLPTANSLLKIPAAKTGASTDLSLADAKNLAKSGQITADQNLPTSNDGKSGTNSTDDNKSAQNPSQNSDPAAKKVDKSAATSKTAAGTQATKQTTTNQNSEPTVEKADKNGDNSGETGTEISSSSQNPNKTPNPPKPKDPNLKDTTPTLTSLNLTLEDNKDIDIKWSGLAFKDNTDIVSFSLDLNSYLKDDVHHFIGFAPADSSQSTNTDPTIAPVCETDSTNSELDTCEFIIKADGSNLDDSTALSSPSPRATFKALPRRSYEANFLVNLTPESIPDPNPTTALLNNTIPAYINYTPPTVDNPPVFSDISKLNPNRQAAINAIAAINITSGSDCKVGKVVKKCYAPANTVNRGAMAEFMRSTLGKPGTTKDNKTISDNKDSDTNIGLNTGRRDAIKWLAAEGITAGTKAGSYKYKKTTYKCTEASFCYKPWDSVSRGAMAEFLWNLAGKPTVTQAQINEGKRILTGNDYTISGNENRTNAILWMAANNITTGSSCQGGKTCYAPKNLVNRGAMAEFLNKFYNMVHYDNPYGKMLKTQSYATTFLGTTWPRADIQTITFTKNPASPIGTTGQTVCKDVSKDGAGSVGTISACSDNDGQDIVISSKGGVVANTNSSYLFYGLSSLTDINGFVSSSGKPDALIDTDKITQMQFMFENAKLPDNLTFPAGFGSATKNMYAMFRDATLPTRLTTFPDGFGKVATEMSYMFSGVILPPRLTFPTGFSDMTTHMVSMFSGATFPITGFTFPVNFGSVATHMESMFENAILKANIDWTAATSLASTLNVEDIWKGTDFGHVALSLSYAIYIANDTIQSKLLNTTIPAPSEATYGNGRKINVVVYRLDPDTYFDLSGGSGQGTSDSEYLYKCYENFAGTGCTPNDDQHTGIVHYYYTWEQARNQVPSGFGFYSALAVESIIGNQGSHAGTAKDLRTWGQYGLYHNHYLDGFSRDGDYWTDDIPFLYPTEACYLRFTPNSHPAIDHSARTIGLSVRYFKLF